MYYITSETLKECAEIYQHKYNILFYRAVESVAIDLGIDKQLLFTSVSSFDVDAKNFMVFKIKHGIKGNALMRKI